MKEDEVWGPSPLHKAAQTWLRIKPLLRYGRVDSGCQAASKAVAGNTVAGSNPVPSANGIVAQLEERCVRNAQVAGSSPAGSTAEET